MQVTLFSTEDTTSACHPFQPYVLPLFSFVHPLSETSLNFRPQIDKGIIFARQLVDLKPSNCFLMARGYLLLGIAYGMKSTEGMVAFGSSLTCHCVTLVVIGYLWATLVVNLGLITNFQLQWIPHKTRPSVWMVECWAYDNKFTMMCMDHRNTYWHYISVV